MNHCAERRLVIKTNFGRPRKGRVEEISVSPQKLKMCEAQWNSLVFEEEVLRRVLEGDELVGRGNDALQCRNYSSKLQ